MSGLEHSCSAQVGTPENEGMPSLEVVEAINPYAANSRIAFLDSDALAATLAERLQDA